MSGNTSDNWRNKSNSLYSASYEKFRKKKNKKKSSVLILPYSFNIDKDYTFTVNQHTKEYDDLFYYSFIPVNMIDDVLAGNTNFPNSNCVFMKRNNLPNGTIPDVKNSVVTISKHHVEEVRSVIDTIRKQHDRFFILCLGYFQMIDKIPHYDFQIGVSGQCELNDVSSLDRCTIELREELGIDVEENDIEFVKNHKNSYHKSTRCYKLLID